MTAVRREPGEPHVGFSQFQPGSGVTAGFIGRTNGVTPPECRRNVGERMEYFVRIIISPIVLL